MTPNRPRAASSFDVHERPARGTAVLKVEEHDSIIAEAWINVAGVIQADDERVARRQRLSRLAKVSSRALSRHRSLPPGP